MARTCLSLCELLESPTTSCPGRGGSTECRAASIYTLPCALGVGLEKQPLHMPECVHNPHVARFRKQNRARRQTRTLLKACLHGVTSLAGVRGIEVKIGAQVSVGVRVTGQSLRYPLLPFCWEMGQLRSCCPQNKTRKELENEERELLAACAGFHD